MCCEAVEHLPDLEESKQQNTFKQPQENLSGVNIILHLFLLILNTPAEGF